MERWASAILAAGKGTRMRSRTPKPLHPLAGRPLVSYPVQALAEADLGPAMIVRDGSNALVEALGPSHVYVVQENADGTGGALRRAVEALGPSVSHLLVLNGDAPFISGETLRRLAARHRQTGAVMTLLASQAAPSEGLGRLVLDQGGGGVARVLEPSTEGYADLGKAPVNCGAYCFDLPWLRQVMPGLPAHGREYFLTDLVAMARAAGRRAECLLTEDPWEALGVNTRVDLARAEQEWRRRTLERLMLAGVTVLDPLTTYVDATVRVGPDTVVHPNTYLRGRTLIGEECVIGPGSQILDSQIGDACRVWSSVLEQATLEDHVEVGPYCHLRPGAYLCRGVRMGNFGEVKASRLGRGVKMGHFGYVGDADIGDEVNIGAGTVTCNFDGVDHHQTVVGEGAFIGSDTMLVAPVRIGARAATAAGAVVTREVPPETLVAGVPARPLRKTGPSASGRGRR